MTCLPAACTLRRLFIINPTSCIKGKTFFDLDLKIEQSDEIRLERVLERFEDSNAVKTRNWQTQESIRQLMNRDVLANIDDWSGLS